MALRERDVRARDGRGNRNGVGERWLGPTGIVAAALIPFMPTWETLVVRASNDALACAMVAIGIAATAYAKPFIEVVAWPMAIAVKLYAWPVAIIAPILWRRQRASKWRVIAVTAAAIGAAAFALLDLSSRTSSAFGVVAFDRPAGAAPPRIDVLQIIKVTIASAAWTSGEHWDALKPLAIAIYVLPVLIAVIMAIRKSEARMAASALAAFAAAQAVNAILWFTARAPQLGGGKEGWYWFVLAPVVVPALVAPAVGKFRWLPWWIVACDVVITDCELIPTWLGLTSPSHPSLLFRWGPMHVPQPWLIPFRAVQFALLVVMVRRA